MKTLRGNGQELSFRQQVNRWKSLLENLLRLRTPFLLFSLGAMTFMRNWGTHPPTELDRLPKAIFLSAGGNDLLLQTFKMILEYKASSAPAPFDSLLLRGFLRRIQRMTVEYVYAIQRLCEVVINERTDNDNLCRNIPVFVHGYDYVEASGKAYEILGIDVAGPWVRPTFSGKGHHNEAKNNATIRSVIKQYNEAICSVATMYSKQDFTMPFYFLDFRGEVGDDWNDEIHPNRNAFNRLAGKIGIVVSDFHSLSREDFLDKYALAGRSCIRTSQIQG